MKNTFKNTETPFKDEPRRKGYMRVFSSPVYLGLGAVLIFAIELSVMTLLTVCCSMSSFWTVIVDSTALTLILSPLLYFMILRPLHTHITERKRSEERLLVLEQAVESMNIGVTVTDLKGRIIYCNPAEAEMHGYSVEELRGKESRVLAPQKRWQPYSPEELEKMKGWQRERNNLRKDGRSFPVQLNSNLVLNSEGKPIGIITNCEDITIRKEAEHAMQESEARYRSLVESTEDSIYLLDRDFRYIFINRRHLQRLGIKRDDIIGKRYSEFHSENEFADLMDKVRYVFDTGGSTQHEHRSRRDGKFFLRTLSPIREGDQIVAVTVISKDISKLKRMEEELRTISLTDDLTGLYNRRGLMTLADQQLKMADRVGKKILVFYADLDGLKKVNDTFGHQEGDQLLVATANIFKEVFRRSDIIARVGGDEFVSMILDADDNEVKQIHERLQESVDQFNSHDGKGYKLEVSFGFTYYDPAKPCSFEELLERADKAMYELKRRREY